MEPMSPAPARTTVAAVVVTWNRRDLLERSLTAILAQHPPPDRLVVVDNASTDGTSDLVAERFPGVELHTCTTNTGGAGGFALGLAAALDDATGPAVDAVWLMDDDTIPQPGALAALVRARERYAVEPGGPLGPPAVVASRVEWVDGREHPMNTPRTKPGVGTAERAAALAVGCAPIRTASFVSILVDVARVREAGLPVAAFFLWNDDFEYSARLLRGRRGLACPASVVRHHTKAFGGTDVDPGPRFYFEVRNKLWTFTRSPALGPVERVLYAGSTARRWARTIARSEDRATLLRGLGRGVRDGLAAPRRTDEVLAEAVPGRLPPVLDGLPGPGGR
jgi:rhamnopyranosyl-N-acetylglucosaminyl-diphospho-decaprenol beta-1,3/1,4-galactofuranosyltransferase